MHFDRCDDEQIARGNSCRCLSGGIIFLWKVILGGPCSLVESYKGLVVNF